MKKILKDTLALFLITVIAGCLLGIVYQITKGPIAEQNAKATLAAYQSIFPDMDTYTEVEMTDELSTKIAEAIAADAENCGNTVVSTIVTAKDTSGNDLGTIYTVTNKEGYGGDIRFTVGIDTTGTITGLEILEISETAGLGMKASESSFRSQFVGICSDTVQYTKSGKSADNEIDAITSATYTTKAIVHGVNSAIAAYEVLGGTVNE